MQRWSALALVGVLLGCALLLVLRAGPAMPLPTTAAASGSDAVRLRDSQEVV